MQTVRNYLIFFSVIFLLVQKVTGAERVEIATIILELKQAEFISFYYHDQFNDERNIKGKSFEKDTIYQFSIPLSDPILLIYNIRTLTPFVIFPGDSILFNYNNNLLTAKNLKASDKSEDLNLFCKRNENYFFGPVSEGLHLRTNSNEGVRNRQKFVKKIFLRNDSVLNRMKSTGILSHRMENYVVEHIRYQYIYGFYRSLLSPSLHAPLIDTLGLSNFFKDELLHQYYYRAAASTYFKYLISRKVDLRASELGKHFSKKTLLYVIFEYERNNNGSDSAYFQFLKNEVMAQKYVDYLLEQKVGAQGVHSSEFLSYDNKPVTVFNQENKILYIDFWASWCAPCREEMQTWKQTRSVLASLNTVYIFLSLDKNKISWKNASLDEGIDAYVHNYFVLNPATNSIVRAIRGVNTIPRYCIMLNGKILNDRAPAPSDPKLVELLKLIKL